MSILTLPPGAEVDGYVLQTDFRLWLEFEEQVRKVDCPAALVRLLCRYYCSPPPADPAEAVAVLCRFYCPEGDRGGRTKGVRACDFEVDAPLIYAAFLSQYGLDLTKAELHWHLFLALFSALGEEQRICRVMGYRTIDLSAVKDPEQKAFYRRMKRQYRLPARVLSEEEIGAVMEGLM